ncbi:MAG: hypothetical protein A7315_01415 [Candidatus Altiarchaeales archaeon WOR_SM1_79]|nr:MAG: hypothetical protein A7315_01415 [Candidatus Altiarchaeales archaeon WOR_SM1_79]
MDEELMDMDTEKKIEKSREVIREAFEKYGRDKIAVAFTGGKDSTLLLWLVKAVCDEDKIPLPKLMFINEGHVFEEIYEFVDELTEKWGLDWDEVRNDDVLKQAEKVGDMVRVDLLSARNRRELEKINFNGKEFPFEPESYVGNHLMKTVAMNLYLERHDFEAVISGIRWDEQESRANETYFSPRKDPGHVRVHPILHFKERDVWGTIMDYNIPYNKLYAQGYRSLGAKGTTTKTTDVPAWEQNLEETTERAGRRQDKEEIMKRLRDLGYF